MIYSAMLCTVSRCNGRGAGGGGDTSAAAAAPCLCFLLPLDMTPQGPRGNRKVYTYDTKPHASFDRDLAKAHRAQKSGRRLVGRGDYSDGTPLPHTGELSDIGNSFFAGGCTYSRSGTPAASPAHRHGRRPRRRRQGRARRAQASEAGGCTTHSCTTTRLPVRSQPLYVGVVLLRYSRDVPLLHNGATVAPCHVPEPRLLSEVLATSAPSLSLPNAARLSRRAAGPTLAPTSIT